MRAESDYRSPAISVIFEFSPLAFLCTFFFRCSRAFQLAFALTSPIGDVLANGRTKPFASQMREDVVTREKTSQNCVDGGTGRFMHAVSARRNAKIEQKLLDSEAYFRVAHPKTGARSSNRRVVRIDDHRRIGGIDDNPACMRIERQSRRGEPIGRNFRKQLNGFVRRRDR